MEMKRAVGVFLISLSFTILLFNVRVTGAVVGTTAIAGLNTFAIALLIVGITLFAKAGSLEKNLAQKTFESGAIITDPRKLKKIARKAGYDRGVEVKEGYEILDSNGKPLTVIPRHHISRGVYRNIMKALSTGEPNFRNYQQV